MADPAKQLTLAEAVLLEIESQQQKKPQSLLPEKLNYLFFEPDAANDPVYVPSRYKVAYGGRGSAKSWGFARLALVLATKFKLRVLCVRELQNSIQESIHKLLSDQIDALGLSAFYTVQNNGIFGTNGSEFIFAGIKTDPGKIKSTEGIDICLVEEAEKVSETSWRILIPTIRKRGSEIWVCFNPRDETDPTYKRFVLRTPPGCRRVKMDWMDNPWFPKELELERQYALLLINEATDDDDRAQAQADYDHVWEGATQKNSNASVFRRRVVVESFEPLPDTRFYFGADWGFANDPTALVRFWITETWVSVTDNEGRTSDVQVQELWIDHEAFGYRVEIDETPKLFDAVPGSRTWPIKADCSRPETISYVGRQGFNIVGAEKWDGSLEDGVAHLKGYHKIHIHTRCKHMQEEARLYAYKTDRVTSEVLPIIVDRHNHGWDAVRYGHDGIIQRRGLAGKWARLAG
jgi:phage terminase large subunit